MFGGVYRTATIAAWGGSGPVVIDIASQSSVTYEVYQTPAFSWEVNVDDSPVNNFLSKFAIGNVDTTGYADVTGFDSKNWTTVITFNLTMPAGLSSNEGIKIDTKFNGGGADFTSNWAWVHGYGSPVRLQINAAAGSGIEMPLDGYDAYNGRWLTIVSSSSNTANSYSNFQSSGFGTPTYFQRTVVYDTETGEELARQDFDTDQTPLGVPFDLAAWMSDGGNSISTDRTVSYSWSIGGPSDSQANCDLRISNWWSSWGTMFDPVGETDRTFLTTRPNAQIGNARAWINGQFTSYGNTANYATAWSTDSEMDLFTPDTAGEGMSLISSGGSQALFDARYSDTIIPKSRNT